METQVDRIVNTLSTPRNQTELLLKLFHQNRHQQDVKHREISMCNKCLTPWTLGKFNLTIRPSNSKRTIRRNHKIKRLLSQIKSKDLGSADVKALNKKIRRLQQQNNHVAFYKCFCSHITKVQLRKKEKDKHNKSESVTSAMIMSKQQEQQIHDNNSKKAKIKKKKKKTAGLLIPPPKTSVKMDVTSSSSSVQNRNKMDKISKMFKDQKNIDETKQQSKLNQFFK